MKILLLFVALISFVFVNSCTVEPGSLVEPDSTLIEDTTETVDSLFVDISDIKFDAEGITINWKPYKGALEYKVYYEAGTFLYENSDCETVDFAEFSHTIDIGKLSTTIYTVAVTAVFGNNHETSIKNKKTVKQDLTTSLEDSTEVE